MMRFKVYLSQEGTEEARRFSLPKNSCSIHNFQDVLQSFGSKVLNDEYTISYKDEEGDTIIVSTQLEWEEALHLLEKQPVAKFMIKSSTKEESGLLPITDIREKYLQEISKMIKERKKIRSVPRFEYLKKSNCNLIPCLRYNKRNLQKRKKKEKKERKGCTFVEFCEMINFPKKDEQEDKTPKSFRYQAQSDLLYQMGFQDTKKVNRLLEKFNGNVQVVVENLLK